MPRALVMNLLTEEGQTPEEVDCMEPEQTADVETEVDILRLCAGECGQKILFFGDVAPDDWGTMLEGDYCLECRSKIIVEESESPWEG